MCFFYINPNKYIFILLAELVRLKLIQASMSGQKASVDTIGPVGRSATLLACCYDHMQAVIGSLGGTCYSCGGGRAAGRIHSPACLDYVHLTFCHWGSNMLVSVWEPGILISSAFPYAFPWLMGGHFVWTGCRSIRPQREKEKERENERGRKFYQGSKALTVDQK